MYSHILITGGAGFVGSSIALDLAASFPGTRITAFDNLHRRGSELNLPRLAAAGVRFLHGDIRCPEDFRALPQPPNLVIECSAEPSAQAGYGGSPEFLIQTNLTGCFRCLELARESKADFLFLSTSRVYPVERLNSLSWREDDTRFSLAEQPEGVSESFPLDGARSLYGMTKLAAELMITEYAAAYGLRCAINRCGLIAGPWQMGKTDQGVVTLWVAAHYFKRPLQYIGFGGTGKQVRDILHVADLCDLIRDQVTHFDRYSGTLFNAGGGNSGSLSLREMTSVCEEVTGNQIDISANTADRPADIRIYITDHRRLTTHSSWRPTRSPQAVIRDIFDWIRTGPGHLKSILD